jgi:hypothetical protein
LKPWRSVNLRNQRYRKLAPSKKSLEKVMVAAAMLNASLPETSPMVAKKRSSF